MIVYPLFAQARAHTIGDEDALLSFTRTDQRDLFVAMVLSVERNCSTHHIHSIQNIQNLPISWRTELVRLAIDGFFVDDAVRIFVAAVSADTPHIDELLRILAHSINRGDMSPRALPREGCALDKTTKITSRLARVLFAHAVKGSRYKRYREICASLVPCDAHARRLENEWVTLGEAAVVHSGALNPARYTIIVDSSAVTHPLAKPFARAAARLRRDASLVRHVDLTWTTLDGVPSREPRVPCIILECIPNSRIPAHALVWNFCADEFDASDDSMIDLVGNAACDVHRYFGGDMRCMPRTPQSARNNVLRSKRYALLRDKLRSHPSFCDDDDDFEILDEDELVLG